MNLLVSTNQQVVIAVVILVLVAMYSDFRWRKIPNCLTLPAIALGFFLTFWAIAGTG